MRLGGVEGVRGVGCWGVVLGGDRGIYIYVAELRSWFLPGLERSVRCPRVG